jgi:hypothetical protein
MKSGASQGPTARVAPPAVDYRDHRDDRPGVGGAQRQHRLPGDRAVGDDLHQQRAAQRDQQGQADEGGDQLAPGTPVVVKADRSGRVVSHHRQGGGRGAKCYGRCQIEGHFHQRLHLRPVATGDDQRRDHRQNRRQDQ